MKKFVVFLSLFALVIGGLVVWKANNQNADAYSHHKSDKLPAVVTVQAEVKPMPLVVTAVGTVEAQNSVAVRAQTTGVLEEVLFREGERVEKNQLLFRIDSRSAQANLDQAKAQLARDQAQLKEARAQQERLAQLIDREYITRAEYEQAIASASALSATAASSKAMIADAQLRLEYSRIHAPIAGRTGSLAVKPGNLVTGGASTTGDPLVVINSVSPILVAFTLPQRHLDDVRRYQKSNELAVEISREADGAAIAEGKLVFIDNNVNAQTGTILLKARSENEEEALWPGQFVAVRLILKTDPDSVVVPEVAVQPGQQGSFVYIVKDGVAIQQAVKVSRQIGSSIVIAEGLHGGEQLITEIPQNLKSGDAVEVRGGVRQTGAGAR